MNAGARSRRARARKLAFSSFDLAGAYKQLQLARLTPWAVTAEPVLPSEFFRQRLAKLQRFDLRVYEESKKLLIDAVLEEGLEGFDQLKVWKGASLEATVVGGDVDYLISDHRDYLEAPFLCVVEAKRDDFEQGLAQCLVEMQACQELNRAVGRALTVFGIVTNGEGWKFYRLLLTGCVEETALYSLQNIGDLLGVLRLLFQECVQNLSPVA